jgi:hypothetical protein
VDGSTLAIQVGHGVGVGRTGASVTRWNDVWLAGGGGLAAGRVAEPQPEAEKNERKIPGGLR